MNISEILRLAFSVVADWHVILTAIITIFIISISNYVIRYKKRPLSLKKRKALLKAQQNSAPKPENKEGGDASGDAAAGDQNKKTPGSSSLAKKK